MKWGNLRWDEANSDLNVVIVIFKKPGKNIFHDQTNSTLVMVSEINFKMNLYKSFFANKYSSYFSLYKKF